MMTAVSLAANYEPHVFSNQLPILKLAVYHLTYYRALSKGYKEHQLQNEFWTLTIDAHLSPIQPTGSDCPPNRRNKYAVHRELEFKDPVPYFDKALAVVFYFDNWVRRVIYPDTVEEPQLESFAKSLEKSVVPRAIALPLASSCVPRFGEFSGHPLEAMVKFVLFLL